MSEHKFSQRYGYRPIRDQLQVDNLDRETRNAIWNALYIDVFSQFSGRYDTQTRQTAVYFASAIANSLWSKTLALPLDRLSDWTRAESEFRDRIFEGEWYDVYDFLEDVLAFNPTNPILSSFGAGLNDLFTRYSCGYRNVSNKIARIIDPVEMLAIETGLNDKHSVVAQHLKTALDALTDRRSPDYRNSIKESISAVEAMVRIASGSHKATLAEALKQFQKTHYIHPSMSNALNRLYGYTSDESGIRHALTEDGVKLDFADAKFMLVACSAFCNYLRELLSNSSDVRRDDK